MGPEQVIVIIGEVEIGDRDGSVKRSGARVESVGCVGDRIDLSVMVEGRIIMEVD